MKEVANANNIFINISMKILDKLMNYVTIILKIANEAKR